MPIPHSLREIPVPIAERTSRTLTRRFEQLEEAGLLEIPHPVDLQTARVTMEIAELICGRDPKDLAPWSYEEGEPINGLAPQMYSTVLDTPLEKTKGLDDAHHLILTGNGIVYLLNRNKDLAGYKLNSKKQPEIADMVDQLLQFAGDKIEDIADRQAEATNKDFNEVLERLEAYLAELKEIAESTKGNRAPDLWAAFLSRVSHLCDIVDEHADEIVNPIEGAPPALFDAGWWLEEIDVSGEFSGSRLGN